MVTKFYHWTTHIDRGINIDIKLKHIDIKFMVVKERVQSGQISIEHIGTNSMIANPLTKGLPPKVFHEHTAHMGVVIFEDIMI